MNNYDNETVKFLIRERIRLKELVEQLKKRNAELEDSLGILQRAHANNNIFGFDGEAG